MRFLRRFTTVIASAGTLLALVFASCGIARAYDPNGLMFYYDFSSPVTTTNGSVLTDQSGNGRNGTFRGSGMTYNSSTHALVSPGGSNGTNYIELAGAFSDFSSGVSIEFEGEFGVTLSAWERVFDFGVPNGQQNDFWVGHMGSSGELALEVWINNVNQGRCHTSTSGTALDTTRTFAKWLVTVDSTNGCRFYKNGVELATQIKNAQYTSDTPAQAHGSAYPLPTTSNRTTNYVGRSNWTADQDFEGSLRYLRVYSRALTPTQAFDNATSTAPTRNVTFDSNGGQGTMSMQTGSAAANLTTNNFSKNGFLFNGWNTNINGTGTAYADAAAYAFNADVTLYAQWVASAAAPAAAQSVDLASTGQSAVLAWAELALGIFAVLSGLGLVAFRKKTSRLR